MITLDCEQGGAEWREARRGIITGSHFKDIIKPDYKAKTTAGRATYMHQLVGERLGCPLPENRPSAAMIRGTELEAEARAWYEMTTDEYVQQVGFVMGDSGEWGVSPDGLVGTDGGVEIKCPEDKQAVKALLSDTVLPDYLMQVHGCIWVTERNWWDFILYTDSGLPCNIIRVERDEEIIRAIRTQVVAFANEVNEAVEKIAAK